MRRHIDDDLYRIHSEWLGPAGYTLPVSIPMRGIPIGMVAGTVSLMILRAMGASGLLLWGVTLVVTVAAAKLVLLVTGAERPVRALAALFASEVSAPRPAGEKLESGLLRPAAIRVWPVRGRTAVPGGAVRDGGSPGVHPDGREGRS